MNNYKRKFPRLTWEQKEAIKEYFADKGDVISILKAIRKKKETIPADETK
jgi:hypothetical protein